MNHGRNGTSSGYGQFGHAVNKQAHLQQQQQAQEQEAAPARAEGGLHVDGYGQVLEMLKIADPDFRESLLRRLAQKDIELAANLRAELRQLGLR